MSRGMSTDLEHNLEAATQAFKAGVTARARGDMETARINYLQAAEKLFLAARLSSGRLRRSRMGLAEDLLAEAEQFKGWSPEITARQKTKPISSGDDQQADSWLLHERPQVSFEDIAGLEDVKEQIRLKLLYPFTHPELAAEYGINPGGGILLYGPPGTGKTLIGRAVANEIKAAFFAIKPSEIMSQWVGVAEQNIARLFEEAAGYSTSVIFLDEMEALAPKRRSSHSTVMKRVVPQLLTEMQGFHERKNTLLFIGATNEPWEIDVAVMRPGRLDRLIYVPPPDSATRRRILELNLKEVPLDSGVDLTAIAVRTENFSGADMASLAQRVRERVFSEAVHQGLARPINMVDFETVLAEMHPSIPASDLRSFENFAAGERRR